ncbi:hypothetical protein B0H13DRAFT_149784 [Mycena leptocephala]|nr:hypothetical protein B0H13DRAFT_149784 [Mycena leptocephala]
MALPPHFTTLNLTGRFIPNHTLSDASDEMLEQQGIEDPELRRAIVCGVLSFNHYTDDDGTERIWVQQELDARPRIVDEDRILDWRERPRTDPLLGPVVARIRRVKTHTLQLFLRKGWTPDTLKYGVLHYHACSNTARSGRTWAADETWGIEVTDGHRRLSRHIRFVGPRGEDIERHLVYDYIGAV